MLNPLLHVFSHLRKCTISKLYMKISKSNTMSVFYGLTLCETQNLEIKSNIS